MPPRKTRTSPPSPPPTTTETPTATTTTTPADPEQPEQPVVVADAGSASFVARDDADATETRPRTRRQQLEQLLVERRAIRDEAQLAEAQRARTPLALELVVISCRWAVERWNDDRTIPEFSFPQRACHLGKQRPDQDCRECAHVKPIPYGTRTVNAHERRYHDHGMVFPLDDAEAEALALHLRGRGIGHLRSIDQEIAWLEQTITVLDMQERAAAERARLEAEEAAARAVYQQTNPLRPDGL